MIPQTVGGDYMLKHSSHSKAFLVLPNRLDSQFLKASVARSLPLGFDNGDRALASFLIPMLFVADGQAVEQDTDITAGVDLSVFEQYHLLS